VTSENPSNSPTPSTEQAQNNAANQAGNPQGTPLPALRAEVKIPPAHSCYEITCKKKRDGWDRAKMFAEFVGIIFLVIYTLYTAGIYRANNKMAESAQSGSRPFVGLQAVLLSYMDKTGKYTDHSTKDSVGLLVMARIKNFGPIPGEHFTADWKVMIGGTEKRGKAKIPDTPYTLNPTQEVYLRAGVDQEFYQVMRGDKTLSLEITVAYDGPGGHYTECNKQQFSPEANGFYNLGNCPK
jgi:hypothetical protein